MQNTQTCARMSVPAMLLWVDAYRSKTYNLGVDSFHLPNLKRIQGTRYWSLDMVWFSSSRSVTPVLFLLTKLKF